jgi:pyrimidine operon attenuation protein/uracil phosphoribosyltransferase
MSAKYIQKSCIFIQILRNDTQLVSNNYPVLLKDWLSQILETYPGLDNTVIVGLQPRGVFLSDKIVAALKQEITADLVQYGKLDITFFRDDIRRELHLGAETHLPIQY